MSEDTATRQRYVAAKTALEDAGKALAACGLDPQHTLSQLINQNTAPALFRVLVEKGIATKEELDAEVYELVAGAVPKLLEHMEAQRQAQLAAARKAALGAPRPSLLVPTH